MYKYRGNSHARKSLALNELAHLHQFPNEHITTYISRVDVMKETISEFNVFNDDSYFVTQALKGLVKDYEVFKF